MEPPPIVIVRPLSRRDWRVLRELRLGALDDSPGAFLSPAGERRSWAERDWHRMAEQKRWFGAFVDDVPVGLAAVVFDQPTGEHYVESMWVLPRLRGHGVASALFGAVEECVRELGGTVLRLWVLAGNDSAATAYLGYGFRSTGLRQVVPGHPDLNEDEFVIDLATRRAPAAHPTIRDTRTVVPAGSAGSSIERRSSTRIP